jgi:tetratricopeptide (TPR) repeat protein
MTVRSRALSGFALTPVARASAVWLVLLTGHSTSAQARVAPGQAMPPAPPLPVIAAEAFPEASRTAIAKAMEAAQARPDDASVVGALGMLLHAWEQFDSAAAAYRRAQALAPHEADWWYLGGLVDTARALPDAAARQFARALALAPARSELVALRLADARLAAGQHDEAARVYDDLVAAPDLAAAAWYGIGRIAVRRGDQEKALTALEKAVAMYPTFGAAHYTLAQVHRRAGNPEAAATAIARQQQCPACGPWPDDPWQARVAVLRDDAFARLARGIAAASVSTTDASDAIQLHEAAVADPATRGQAHVNLIELYRRTGNHERARQHYLAVRADPAFQAEAHRQYAAVLLDRGDVAEALTLFEHATTHAPRDAAAWLGRGLALERLGRAADASAAYDAALDVAPDNHRARFGLARLAMGAGRVDEAIVHLEALRTPRHAELPRYLFALSTAYLRQGRRGDAIRTGTDALTLARQLGDERMATFIEGEMRKLGPTP